jgi:hypothetical protein
MKIIIFVLFALAATSSFSKTVIYKKDKKVFKNKNCKETDSCDLVEFGIKNKESESFHGFNNGYPNYSSSMVAWFKTKKIDQLEKYAVVQYIRGCIFYSKDEGNGEVSKRIGHTRRFFGKSEKFKHPEWVIDSLDKDPMYWSASIEKYKNRHGLHRLDEPNHYISQPNKKYYFRNKVKGPQLFIADMPTGASFMNEREGYQNSSLEFKTCLYKTSSLAITTDPFDVNLDEALVCYPWRSSHIYNFVSKEYEHPDKVDPYCLE